ncbi:MAG: hypothetical protein NTZ05_02370 [Chloroflexi bacterium]|nr:hypothetical protein [Chloroflexota bacterium]
MVVRRFIVSNGGCGCDFGSNVIVTRRFVNDCGFGSNFVGARSGFVGGC